jgi:GNAT superfamily N-acetyltransferase
MPITIREYNDGDSIEALTLLLNRAYASLADQGLRYVASWQTPEMTLERIHQGTCFIALDGEEIVGTAMLYPTDEYSECAHYRQPGVFHFGKFAVDPDRQGEGIGRLLYKALEDPAREQGATEFACDTAEPATHLIQMYRRWGFEIIGRQDWSLTNYISVVLSKRL